MMNAYKSFTYAMLMIASLSFWQCRPATEHTEGLSIGKLDRITDFHSDYVPNRTIEVWLPDSYDKDQKYAVLYMHDGQMLWDSTTTWNKQEWGVDECMTKLMANDTIRQTIVVGIYNTEYRHSEYFPQKPFESLPKSFQDSLIQQVKRNEETALFKSEVYSDKYLQFITKELKPYIDQHYATLTDRANTFIAGSSMGGLISMYALCEYPEIFGGAACLSTHWVGTFETENNPIPQQFAQYLEGNIPALLHHKIYFDYGTETLDQLYEPFQLKIDSILQQRGYEPTLWMTKKFEGADHSERSWSKRLDIPLAFLLSK